YGTSQASHLFPVFPRAPQRGHRTHSPRIEANRCPLPAGTWRHRHAETTRQAGADEIPTASLHGTRLRERTDAAPRPLERLRSLNRKENPHMLRLACLSLLMFGVLAPVHAQEDLAVDLP